MAGDGEKRPEPWTTLDRATVGDYEIFRVERLRVRSPRDGKEFTRYFLDLPNWVNVIAFNEQGKVLMAEQYRFAAGEVTLEFPAGSCEEGEDARDAARRELEEETGYEPGTLEVLDTILPDPAILDNTLTVVLARGCRKTSAPHQDEGEDVFVREHTPQEIEELLAQGRIRHALGVAAWYVFSRRARRDDG